MLIMGTVTEYFNPSIVFCPGICNLFSFSHLGLLQVAYLSRV